MPRLKRRRAAETRIALAFDEVADADRSATGVIASKHHAIRSFAGCRCCAQWFLSALSGLLIGRGRRTPEAERRAEEFDGAYAKAIENILFVGHPALQDDVGRNRFIGKACCSRERGPRATPRR